MHKPSFSDDMDGSSRLLPIRVAQTPFTAVLKGNWDRKACWRAVLSERSGAPIFVGLRRGRTVYQAFRKRGDVGRHLGIMVEGQQRSPRRTGAAPHCLQATCSQVQAGCGRFRTRTTGGGLARTGFGRSRRDQRNFGTNASAVLRSRVGLFQLRPPAAPSQFQPAAFRLVPSSFSRM